MSAQDKLDRRAAKHGLGSDERKRKIQKAKDFFSKPVPTYSKDELRKMGHPVESAKVPAGMKFIASYVYKDANGNKHTHRHLRKGTKMTDPVVVYIDGKEWKTFQSFTKAKQASINHIKGMKESVEMNEKASHDEIMKDINDFLRNNDGSGVAGMSRRLEKKYGIGPAQARSMIKTALQKVKALPKTGPNKMGRFPHMNEETAIAHQTPYGTVTAYKRDTKGMRGKQDGFKLTLKTKSGKTVDLGSHPKPTKANVMSIVKNVMQKESVEEGMFDIQIPAPKGSNKNTDKQRAAKDAKRAERRAKIDNSKHAKAAISKASAKDKRHSASGNLTKSYDPNRKKYQSGSSGRYFAKYESTTEYGKSEAYIIEAVSKVKTTMPDKVASSATRFGLKAKTQGGHVSISGPKSKLNDFLRAIIGRSSYGNASELNEAYRKPTAAEIAADKAKERRASGSKGPDSSARYKNIKKKMYGNATGGLKDSVATADRKPQNYRDPETGKLKTRMVPVDKDVVRGNDKARVVKHKKFKDVRKRDNEEV